MDGINPYDLFIKRTIFWMPICFQYFAVSAELLFLWQIYSPFSITLNLRILKWDTPSGERIVLLLFQIVIKCPLLCCLSSWTWKSCRLLLALDPRFIMGTLFGHVVKPHHPSHKWKAFNVYSLNYNNLKENISWNHSEKVTERDFYLCNFLLFLLFNAVQYFYRTGGEKTFVLFYTVFTLF